MAVIQEKLGVAEEKEQLINEGIIASSYFFLSKSYSCLNNTLKLCYLNIYLYVI